MLVSPSLVASRLTIGQSVPDFDTMLNRAVDAGSRTALSRARYPEPVQYSGVRDLFRVRSFDRREPVLRLSRGFVSSIDAAYSASTARAALAGASGDGSVDLTDPETATLLVDGERGIVTLADFWASTVWIAVTHTGGLTVGGDGAYQGVPEAMQEFALGMSIMALRVNRIFTEEETFPFDVVSRQTETQLREITRAVPGSLKPISTDFP